MDSYIEGEVGVWTGCGFNTIPVLFPPPEILGYDACVPPILDGQTGGIGVVSVLPLL